MLIPPLMNDKINSHVLFPMLIRGRWLCLQRFAHPTIFHINFNLFICDLILLAKGAEKCGDNRQLMATLLYEKIIVFIN